MCAGVWMVKVRGAFPKEPLNNMPTEIAIGLL